MSKWLQLQLRQELPGTVDGSLEAGQHHLETVGSEKTMIHGIVNDPWLMMMVAEDETFMTHCRSVLSGSWVIGGGAQWLQFNVTGPMMEDRVVGLEIKEKS